MAQERKLLKPEHDTKRPSLEKRKLPTERVSVSADERNRLNYRLIEAVFEGSLQDAGRLLMAGAEPDARVNVGKSVWRLYNDNGKTALMMAARHGNTGICNLLIWNGAEVNAKENASGGKTALMEAACGKNISTCRLLIENGADVNARDGEGITLLMRVANWVRGSNVCRFLVDNGADVKAKNNRGENALIFALMAGNADAAKLLIRKGADVNAKSGGGLGRDWTALIMAANGGHAEVCKLLMERGADILAKDADGRTALWYAHYGFGSNARDARTKELLDREYLKLFLGEERTAAFYPAFKECTSPFSL
jgi:ankyrin repeat protein